MIKNYNYSCRYYSGKGLGSNEICYLADIVNIADYSPFGVQLDGRTITSEKYRYGYQGMEKDDEVKGEGNSYTTHFRQLDSRIGRWLSIDPKSSSMPWQSPFVSMDNNPIFYNDILGDIVDKRNASGNKKAFRKFKRNIKRLRKNSASFEKMYSDMENRDDLFVFELANRKGAETLKPWETEDGSTVMQFSIEEGGNIGTIAHETGHGWRILHKLDTKTSLIETKYPIGIMNSAEKKRLKNDYYSQTSENNKAIVKSRKQSETGAMHIENIVISELKRTGKQRFNSLNLQEEYYSGIGTKLLNSSDNILYVGLQNYVPFTNKYPMSFYKKKINIHDDHGVNPIKK